ncbi:MAG: hypothetical protein J0H15_03550 [Xanthomonadales bacterium]|nr:hypothetical protein [Xanthomonadales bacterium]
MQKRLTQLLALSTSLLATGAAIVFLAPGEATPATQAAAVADLPTTHLPTIHVEVDLSPRLLPTVIVRPVSQAVARGHVETPDPLQGFEFELAQFGSGGSGGAFFDMPYYSFGQSYRRANKD